MLRTFVLNRLREPSTYAGFVALLGVFGLPDGVPQLAGQVLAGIGGLAAVFLAERKPA